MINLLKDCKLTRVENAAAAAQTAVDTDVIDMAGFDSCTFIALLGDVDNTSVLTLTVQHGDLSNGSDMASTTVSTTHTADATDADDMVLAVEIMRPIKRYVRARLTRTTADAVVDGIFAIQSNSADAPVTHDTTTILGTDFGLAPATA
jgi:hypothetical protein